MASAGGVNAKGLLAFVWRMEVSIAEIHWYEASGIGRKEFKIKALLGSE